MRLIFDIVNKRTDIVRNGPQGHLKKIRSSIEANARVCNRCIETVEALCDNVKDRRGYHRGILSPDQIPEFGIPSQALVILVEPVARLLIADWQGAEALTSAEYRKPPSISRE